MRIPIGAIILSIFAVIWTAAGTRNLERRWFVSLLLGAILISLGVIYAGAHMQTAHPLTFNARAYNLSILFEGVLIFFAVLFLRCAERKHLLLPVISIVVGLHFIGMVWALGSNLYWWISAGMCLLPVTTMSILPRSVWEPVVGIGCAVILWTSAICAFF